MSDTPGFHPTPVHSADVVCEVVSAVGIPLDPTRLRSWHSREKLALGGTQGRWFRYSDFDVLAVALLAALTEAGIPAGELAPVLPEVRWDAEWTMRVAVQGQSEPSEDVFVGALRRRGEPLILFSGSRDEVLDKAGSLASIKPLPVTLLNLTILAEAVRKALVARAPQEDTP